MKTSKRSILTSLTALAIIVAVVGVGSANAAGATVSTADAAIVSDGYVNANSTGSTGRNPAGDKNFRAFAVFSVVDIMANEDSISSIADFDTTSFILSFDTVADSVKLSAGSYKGDYLGFFPDSNFPDSGGGTSGNDWVGKYDAASTQTIDTGIADTFALQTGITASGFNTLTDVTEADTANDVVLFRVRYDEPQASGDYQTLDNYTLTVVPEPGSLGLFGIVSGVLWFVRRKFRGIQS